MKHERTFNLSRANALALLCIAPFLLRMWIEAVVWRLERGPQMLGFSLAHGAAGWLTPLLLFSALVAFTYFWTAGLLLIAHLIPAVRARTRGIYFVGTGVLALGAFSLLSDALQSPSASSATVIVGGVLLAVLLGGIGWTVVAGLRAASDSRGL